ncbi:uncharacterized protein [Onthophagus taurus]|uniref:uncharacterized protein n=1 Tax=Onthophagus taurus TaxID=166361 RepID=UPI0039BEA472
MFARNFMLFFCLVVVATKNHTIKFKNEVSHRHGKFIPFWNWGIGVVRFKNDECSAADGLSGTCYTKRQCSDIDGIASGGCASNIGVCCVIQRSCGSTSSYNNTYFVSSPSFKQTTGANKCIYTVPRCDSDICQIRIDFLSFSLMQPNAQGVCANDAFNVIGGAYEVPEICGENSGQHLYVNFNGADDIKLVINTNSDSTFGRSWRFKVTQIGCDCPTRAPNGCLQHYTGISGVVQSLNYGTTIAGQGTRQLANTNYGICVAPAAGYCGIQWSQGTASPNTFTISGDATMAPTSLSGDDCTTDFIVVANPYIAGTPANTDRFCGTQLPTLVSYSRPFVLYVVTDGNEANDVANSGFLLSYTQLACRNSICR